MIAHCSEVDFVTYLGREVDLVLTSPPYNIGSKQKKKVGYRKIGKYDPKSWGAIEGYRDSIPEADYQNWQRSFLERYAKVLKSGGSIAYNHKERHVQGRLIQPESWFPNCLELYDKIVWNRKSTHNHCQNYAYQQHEYFYMLKLKGDRHFFNPGRLDSVVSVIPDYKGKHNAPMPVDLAEAIITKFSPINGLVVDPFSGSGTTWIACKNTGRRFYGSEKLKKYIRLAEARINGCSD